MNTNVQQLYFEETINKNTNEQEFIRERALTYGIDTLSNKELLSMLSTKKNKEQIDKLIEQGIDIIDFFNSNNIDFLTNIFGKNAMIIKSILELYKRRTQKKEFKITQPKDVAEYLMEELRYLKQEVLVVLYLNTKNVIISKEIVSKGSLNSSIVHPREVFAGAIKNGSASIVVAHNHPSGDATPSNEDISVTNRLKECGKLLGIDLLDHVIIGNGKYESLKERGNI